MPKILLYLLGVSQSDVDNELVDIHELFKLDRDRGDKAFHATPSELRNPPAKRPKFQELVSCLKEYDTLVTTRAVGLGRSKVEVLNTVELLKWNKVRVHCLELGIDHRAELTSYPGSLIMNALAVAVALESGEKARRRAARHKTKIQGRPPALSTNKRREVLDRLRTPDANITRVAATMRVSRACIYRTLKLAGVDPPLRARARFGPVARR